MQKIKWFYGIMLYAAVWLDLHSNYGYVLHSADTAGHSAYELGE